MSRRSIRLDLRICVSNAVFGQFSMGCQGFARIFAAKVCGVYIWGLILVFGADWGIRKGKGVLLRPLYGLEAWYCCGVSALGFRTSLHRYGCSGKQLDLGP